MMREMNEINIVELTWKAVDAVEDVLKQQQISLSSNLGTTMMRRIANALTSLAESAETIEVS